MKSLERIADVNLNRLAEALRLIEDYTRFVLADSSLTERLKNMRHRVRRLDSGISMASRNSEKDLGRKLHTEKELERNDWSGILIAAFKRSQESARVLEELFKIRSKEKALKLKQYRFELYDLEKEVLCRHN